MRPHQACLALVGSGLLDEANQLAAKPGRRPGVAPRQQDGCFGPADLIEHGATPGAPQASSHSTDGSKPLAGFGLTRDIPAPKRQPGTVSAPHRHHAGTLGVQRVIRHERSPEGERSPVALGQSMARRERGRGHVVKPSPLPAAPGSLRASEIHPRPRAVPQLPVCGRSKMRRRG